VDLGTEAEKCRGVDIDHLSQPGKVLAAQGVDAPRVATDEIADGGSTSTAESEALRRLGSDAVHAALRELPEEQRAAITLMDLNGLTAKETGRIMGTPRNTVLSRVHRGRKRLAFLLEKKVTIDEGA